MSDGLLFVLLCLGVFRLWRLIGRDDLTAPLRENLPMWLLKPLVCPHCAGTWWAVAAVLLCHFHVVPLGPSVWLWAGGVSAAVGFLGEIDAKLDPPPDSGSR